MRPITFALFFWTCLASSSNWSAADGSSNQTKVAVLSFSCAADGVPRVGLISDLKSRGDADLLMLELQKTRCELVERDEMNKILSEQGISLAKITGKESQRVGHLLKADGLVLLTKQTNNTCRVRFIAVTPGIIVWSAEFQLPEENKKDIEPWQKIVAESLSGYLPKLTVKAGDAVPISLMRLSSRFDNRIGSELEQQVNVLLFSRLLREPRFFVLERDNMAQLEMDKTFGGDSSGFWTGAYLLDGWLATDLAGGTQVTVTLRVRGPGRDQPRELTERGEQSVLMDLVERLVRRLTAEYGWQASTVAWNPLAEGRQFLGLAEYSGEHSRMKAAIDSAWALGCREQRAAILRLAAFVREAQGYGYGAEAETRYEFNKPHMIVSLQKHPEHLEKRLDALRSALTFYRTYVVPSSPPLAGREYPTEWRQQGQKAAESTALMIEYLASLPNRSEYVNVITQLQRDAVAILEQSPAEEVKLLLAEHTALLYREPEKVVAVYKRLLSQEGKPTLLVRCALITRRGNRPRFVDWDGGHQAEFESLWGKLLSELSADGSLAVRISVMRMQLDSDLSAGQTCELRRKARQLVTEHREELLNGGLNLYEDAMSLGRQGGKFASEDRAFAFGLSRFLCERMPDVPRPDVHHIAFIFLYEYSDSLTLSEARTLYAACQTSAIRRDCYENETIRLSLLRRFPELAVNSVLPLMVNRRMELTSDGLKLDGFDRGTLGTYQWWEGCLWFYQPNCIVAVDVTNGQCRAVAGPPALGEQLGRAPCLWTLPVYLLMDANQLILVHAPNNEPATLYVRPRIGGNWKMYSNLPALRGRPLLAGGCLYGLYDVLGKRGAGNSFKGLFRLPIGANKAELLSDPTGPVAQSPLNRAAIEVRSVTLGPGGEIWVRTARETVAFDPLSNFWRTVASSEWSRLPAPELRVVGQLAWPEPAPRNRLVEINEPNANTGGLSSLVWRDGDTGHETVIPLKFDDPPCKRGNISSPVTYGHFEYSFVEVPGFVFFPMKDLCGFWVLPLADIEKYVHLSSGRAKSEPTRE